MERQKKNNCCHSTTNHVQLDWRAGGASPVQLGWVCHRRRSWRSWASSWRTRSGSSWEETSSVKTWSWWGWCRGSQYASPCGPERTGHTWACTGSTWEQDSATGLNLNKQPDRDCRAKVQFCCPDLVPATAPSFLPSGSSSSTPHHSPLAKSVSPRNRTTPAFVPPTYKRKDKACYTGRCSN